jgi:glycosyltransferase involved in cell wall biosynthesis
MNYHIAFGRIWDFDRLAEDSAAGKAPRHVIFDLARRIGADCHVPNYEPNGTDRLRAKLVNTPEQWALARNLADRLTANDLIYCTGEDVGLPLAFCCNAQNLPRIVLFLHAGHKLRNRLLFALGNGVKKIALFVTNCEAQVQFLLKLGVEVDRIHFLLEQTDTAFFSPGPANPNSQSPNSQSPNSQSPKARPIIASVGLEFRDYRTLAAATADMDVDVRISGFSKDIAAMARSFPDVVPRNMDRRFYSWPDLTQLYRDADIVVVSLFPSDATSGVTTLLEAMACRRPVIASQTIGLVDYIDDPDTVTTVPVEDVDRLRTAIQTLLADREAADRQAEAGYQRVQDNHRSEPYIAALMSILDVPQSIQLAQPQGAGIDNTPAQRLR